MPFTDNYIAPDGTFYTQVVEDMQSTEAFGYRYDARPLPDNKVVDRERSARLLSLFSTAAGINAAGDMQRIQAINTESATPIKQLNKEIQLRKSTLPDVTGAAAPAVRAREVFALIRSIKMDDNVASVRVFVNLKNVTLDVPESDPHFVTTLGFLDDQKSDNGTHSHRLPSVIVDLTETLKKLSSINNDMISVQLLVVSKPGVALEKGVEVVPALIEFAEV